VIEALKKKRKALLEKLNKKTSVLDIKREENKFVKHSQQLTERLLKINPSLKKPRKTDYLLLGRIALAYNDYVIKNNIKSINNLTKQDVSTIFKIAYKK